MPQDFYPDLVRLLQEAGFERMPGRGKGSHERWINTAQHRMATVSRTKSRHTANAVLKQAGLPKAF